MDCSGNGKRLNLKNFFFLYLYIDYIHKRKKEVK
uniref:Uncharacterized protein n=1 Tax=Anguilla anguilla TaxID=7936 RepID=A0A0E9W383_ANGAN